MSRTILRPDLTEEREKEKFAEPFYAIFPSAEPYVLAYNPYYYGPDERSVIGYEYLAVPNDAESRIDALLARVESGGPTGKAAEDPSSVDSGRDGLNIVSQYARNSYVEAKKILGSVNASLTSEKPEEMAKRWGVDPLRAKYWQKIVTDTARQQSQGAFKTLNTLTDGIPPISMTMANVVLGVVMGSTPQAQASAILDGAISIASTMWPIVGAAASLAKTFIFARSDGDDVEKAIKKNQEAAEKAKNETAVLNLPVPWHAPRIFPFIPLKAGNEERSKNLKNILELNYRYLTAATQRKPGFKLLYFENEEGSFGLNEADRALVGQWWSMATTFMGHHDVYPVFHALGWEEDPATWVNMGGTWATDEQVLLVAAPFAAQYGYPLREFAIDLWNACPGWRSADESSKVYGRLAKSAQADRDPSNRYLSHGQNVVLDAWWLNWAALTKTAFELSKKREEARKVAAQRAFEENQRRERQELLARMKTSSNVLDGIRRLESKLAMAPRFRARKSGESVEEYRRAKNEWETERQRAENEKKVLEQKALEEERLLREKEAAAREEARKALYEQSLVATRSNADVRVMQQIVPRQDQITTETSSTQKKEGLSTGAKVAIGFGIAALVGGGFYLYKRRH